MKITSSLNFQIYVSQVGDFYIVSHQSVPKLEKLDGVLVGISSEIREEFASWLGKQTVDEVNELLGMSHAKVGRLRAALNVQRYTRPGNSPATRWRRTGTTLPNK